jgi:hypothetical protein
MFANYMLWGFKLVPVNPEAVLVIYESTIQFPSARKLTLNSFRSDTP